MKKRTGRNRVTIPDKPGSSSMRFADVLFCDAHIDTLSKMLKFGWKTFSEIPGDSHVTARRLRQSKVGAAVFALFTEKYDRSLPPLQRTLKMIEMAHTLERDHPDILELTTDSGSITRAWKRGRTAIILSLENGIAIGTDLGRLHIFHQLGVRIMSLTWNYRNQLGDGVGMFRARRGLTPFGREALREMKRLGMIIDASHLNELTFWQVIETADGPVSATHSNALGACSNPRNLTDEQIVALSQKGGFIGLNFCKDFLNDSGEASIDDVVRHASYIAELAGTGVLAIGSDFDGILEPPAGLEHIGKMQRLITAFQRAGFSRSDIEAISHRNFLRVFRKVCG